jgi:Transcriptional regulator, AbiEi antitoxin, Type IV TA system/Transcriptional regulator, AbiEi antitoxin N-terminal domain
MSSYKGTKINQLLKQWPNGTVAVSSWLENQGAYQQLVHKYETTAWVRRIGQGAYAKAGDKVAWTGGLYALQEQLKLPVHAGGKTALQMQGYAHFLPMGKGTPVSLFAPPDVKLPTWFKQYPWGIKLRYTTTNLFTDQTDHGLTKQDLGPYQIKLSAPERAMMEVMYGVPLVDSYEEARLLIEGLTTLRPRLVQSLLERCVSVKVKRLFMLLAESCKHAWVKKVDLSRVDFGKGKRTLVKGGHFDPKYQITVPNPEAGSTAPGV